MTNSLNKYNLFKVDLFKHHNMYNFFEVDLFKTKLSKLDHLNIDNILFKT